MLKVKVTVPAACIGLGPGLDALGLALALHNTLEFGVRADSQFAISISGEGSYPASLRHPAMHAAITLFQLSESAPAGLNVTITNRIPQNCGLGDLAALTIGGLVGANNLLAAPLKREALIELACSLTKQPASVVTALLGGLAITSGMGHELIYRRIDVTALKVVIIVPELPAYEDPAIDLPPITLADMSFNIGQAALVVEALRKSDFDLLGRALRDRLLESQLPKVIPGYAAVIAAAREAGAIGVTLCGNGPALMAFTQVNHKRVEDSMQQAFSDAKIRARVWTVNVDTQGVAINVTQ